MDHLSQADGGNDRLKNNLAGNPRLTEGYLSPGRDDVLVLLMKLMVRFQFVGVIIEWKLVSLVIRD